MATPFHEIPEPKSSVAGRNNRAISNNVAKTLSLWRPKGAREAGLATIARFAHRLIGSDGNAFTADELRKLTNAAVNTAIEGNAEATLKSLVGGFTSGNMLRVKAGGGLEELTPAQVRDEIATALQNAINPAFPSTIEISGALTSDGLSAVTFPPLSFAGIYNGRPSYTDDSNPIPAELSFYTLAWSGSFWEMRDWANSTAWTSGTDVDNPEYATGWSSIEPATGIPAVYGLGNLSPSFIGQLCRVGNSAPYDWYRADTLTSWVPLVIGGAPVSWNADQSAYQALVISGESGSEMVTITSI